MSLALAPVAGAALVAVERRVERSGTRVPLLPPSLLRTRSMRRGLTIAVPLFADLGGVVFVYALTLQDGLRLGPLAAGLALTPMVAAHFVASLCSGRMVARLDRAALPLAAAVQVSGIALAVAAVLAHWDAGTALALAPGLLLADAGQGVLMTTLFRWCSPMSPPTVPAAAAAAA